MNMLKNKIHSNPYTLLNLTQTINININSISIKYFEAEKCIFLELHVRTEST